MTHPVSAGVTAWATVRATFVVVAAASRSWSATSAIRYACRGGEQERRGREDLRGEEDVAERLEAERVALVEKVNDQRLEHEPTRERVECPERSETADEGRRGEARSLGPAALLGRLAGKARVRRALDRGAGEEDDEQRSVRRERAHRDRPEGRRGVTEEA